jgi:hypothetical protein
MSREAMKQALEALELLARYENPSTKIQVRKPKDGGSIVTMYPHKVATEAAALLRERLAQPEHDYRTRYDRGCYKCGSHYCPADCPDPTHLVPQQPLYTSPPKTEQEPVAFINVEKQKLEWAKLTSWHTPTIVNLPKIPLYTAPPKAAEWVGLTDEQVEDEWERITGHSIFGGDRSEGRAMYISPDEVIEFSRAIEAKLKEKNT